MKPPTFEGPPPFFYGKPRGGAFCPRSDWIPPGADGPGLFLIGRAPRLMSSQVCKNFGVCLGELGPRSWLLAFLLPWQIPSRRTMQPRVSANCAPPPPKTKASFRVPFTSRAPHPLNPVANEVGNQIDGFPPSPTMATGSTRLKG